ncbi:MAG: iron ABC transporter permease [Acidimicrobiales bacterium]|nr:iron ABC transporter permease [Acidimicrobiales bacterium]
MTPRSAPVGLRLLGGVVALLFSGPALYLLWRNFDESADPFGLLGSAPTLEPLGRTLQLAVAVSVSAALLGTFLAWISIRTDVPGARIWRVLLPIPLVFPTFLGAAAFIRTLSPGGLVSDLSAEVGVDLTRDIRGFSGAWLVLTLFTYPYVYLPVAARLRQLPGSLEESARVLGDSPTMTFRRIVMPQIASSVMAGSVLVFLYTISDFGAVQLMRYDTLTRAIHTNHLARPPVALALSLILLVLALVVVVGERIASKRLVAVTTNRAQRPMIYRLGRGRWVSWGVVSAVFSLAVIAPLATLTDWAWDGLRRSSTGGRSLTIDSDKVIESSVNTLQVSVIAAVVAVLAVLPVAFLVGRYRSKVGSWSHVVVVSTFALPGILIALALTYWVRSSSTANDLFAGTMLLLIFGLVVRFGSLALGVTLDAVRAVPGGFHDAAATLGAGKLRRFRTIDLPIMGPGLLAGGGLVLLSVMKELPITLLVAPLGFPTLTTRIFQSFEDAFVAEAGIMAVVLVAMSSLLSWFLVIRRADHL